MDYINIVGTIFDNSTEHAVALASQVKDLRLNKKQQDINQEVEGNIQLLEQVCSRVPGIEENLLNYYTKTEADAIINLCVTRADYNYSTKRLRFYNGDTLLFSIDATPFIKDGMVNNVEISNSSLVITFNTDSGLEPISIPLTDIFNPDNYYTKTDTDGLLTLKQDVIQDLAQIRQGASAGATAYERQCIVRTDKDTAYYNNANNDPNDQYSATLLGVHNKALGYGAFAGGIDCEAGDRAAVFNSGNKATGSNSFACGLSTTASGNNSHAEGSQTEAGDTAHAEGFQSKALGQNSHAEGSGTYATGKNSHAEGAGMEDPTGLPNDTTDTSNNGLEARGEHSHAEGWATKAFGNKSHAEGERSIATGDMSHAEGYQTIASGNNSHAEGSDTVASGQNSHAEGAGGTTSSGKHSHAEGWNTHAYADKSHTQGESTEARCECETAIGRFNKSNTGTTDSQKTRFSVGIGSSENNRSNGFEVCANGDMFVLGVGGYDGTNINEAMSIQDVVNFKIDQLTLSDDASYNQDQLIAHRTLTLADLNHAELLLSAKDIVNNILVYYNNNDGKTLVSIVPFIQNDTTVVITTPMWEFSAQKIVVITKHCKDELLFTGI